MTTTQDKQIDELIERIFSADFVDSFDIPEIPLYMDQVTTFMEQKLGTSRRYDTDKIMTKTMINNYAKNKLLPPPEKKKYSKDHILLLIFIYYMKNVLCINDISALLKPLENRYFQSDSDFTMQNVYDEIIRISKNNAKDVKELLSKEKELATASFPDAPDEDREFLQLFSYIAMLSYDVYLKKQIVETLVDHLDELQTKQD